jgi:hypothetical protein
MTRSMTHDGSGLAVTTSSGSHRSATIVSVDSIPVESPVGDRPAGPIVSCHVHKPEAPFSHASLKSHEYLL